MAEIEKVDVFPCFGPVGHDLSSCTHSVLMILAHECRLEC